MDKKNLFFSSIAAINIASLSQTKKWLSKTISGILLVVTSWLGTATTTSVEYTDDGRTRERHFPEDIPPNVNGKACSTRVVKVCTKKDIKRKETRVYCPDYPSTSALDNALGLIIPKSFYWK